MNQLMGLVSELRRRNVFRMAVLYVVAAWLIMQVADVIITLANLPSWSGQLVLAVLAIGFPLALILSWLYELTPEGIVPEKHVDRAESITHITGRRMDFVVIALLSAGLILFAYDKWWIGPPPEKSIAVLAFENMSADPEQEYFSDGISEELLNLLAQIPELTVISRSSAFSFKGKDVAVPEIAKQLNVAHVLEGSVRTAGNRVRITAQLIDAGSDSHLWSETYDRELDDIFTVQNEIAEAISDALKIQLTVVPGEAVQPTVINTASTEAYDAYLRGRQLVQLRGQENLEEAIRHLERSLRLDEGYAPAHAQLAIATYLSSKGMLEEAMRVAIPHLDQAQELAPDLAEAHAGRALLMLSIDGESAVEHARKALALNPSYIDAMNWLAMAQGGLGRYKEQDATRKQMLIIDPLSVNGRYNYGYLLCAKGRVEDAHEVADQLVVQNPRMGYALHAEASYGWEGKLAEGVSWSLRAAAEGYVHNDADWVRGYVWVGEHDEARRISSEMAYMVDVAEGRFDEAIQATQRRMQGDPDNVEVIAAAANVLYTAGRIDDALPLYERLRDFGHEGHTIPWSHEMDIRCNCMTMRLALARRKAGDEEGAQAAAQITRSDQTARNAAGRNSQYEYRTEAMIAAFEKNSDGVIDALRVAIQLGLRDRQVFEDAIFEELWDEPEFVALQVELDAILAVEHDEILQLICFNNPTPDNWQPLPETCEGVVEQRVL